LQLALPAPEPHTYAKERRLFYVAVTRTRKTLLLLTQLGRELTFITKLVKEHKVSDTDTEGETKDVEFQSGKHRA
jgi:DNA helicase-4